MADYQKMYSLLFNAITDIIDILQKAQKETEELYISAAEPDIMVLATNDKNRNIEDKH